MAEKDNTPQPGAFSLDREILNQSVVIANLNQEVLVVTADRARLCLRDYEAALRAQVDWKGDLGLLATALAALVAADFRNFLGIPPELWRTLFTLGAFVGGYRLFKSLVLSFRRAETWDAEAVVERLKKSSSPDCQR